MKNTKRNEQHITLITIYIFLHYVSVGMQALHTHTHIYTYVCVRVGVYICIYIVVLLIEIHESIIFGLMQCEPNVRSEEFNHTHTLRQNMPPYAEYQGFLTDTNTS